MTEITIPPEDRALAAITHLSGLSGYIIPLGGVLVPIIIWMVKKDAPIIAAIARQAILLNLIVFALVVVSFVLWITIILIPFAILFWIALGIVAVALPVVGAIKANQGIYYRYPVVGSNP
jgi:uncharacterized Tic20 family protein